MAGRKGQDEKDGTMIQLWLKSLRVLKGQDEKGGTGRRRKDRVWLGLKLKKKNKRKQTMCDNIINIVEVVNNG